MFKIYKIYLIKKFLIKFTIICLIFFSLTIILGVLEEISFLQNQNKNFLYPFFLALLNSPITLFEIFPFIFLLTTQFFFYEIFKNEELYLLKVNGLSNFKIINLLFFLSLMMGLISIIFFYNFSSILKFKYSALKNELSNDNKYLAMVNESGLWIKDEVDDKKLIIKSKKIEKNFLTNVTINEFDSNFDIIRTIQSNKVDIGNFNWIIYEPKISKSNNTSESQKLIYFKTNFNDTKIINFFSNFSTLNLIELLTLKKDFEKFGYSSNDIMSHLYKLIYTPIFYGILTMFSCILVFNFLNNTSLLLHVTIGILTSVIIYYINFIFNSLGNNANLPINLSIIFPLIIISIINFIGLININEK